MVYGFLLKIGLGASLGDMLRSLSFVTNIRRLGREESPVRPNMAVAPNAPRGVLWRTRGSFID